MSDIIKKSFDSRYFTLKELTKGVYAAIEKKEAETGSNAGFIDMWEYTVVFDAFLNIDAAKDLKEAAEALTGKTPSVLVNSHFHADHIMGNCIYEDSAKIIASKACNEKMLTESTKMIQELSEVGPKALEEIKGQLAVEKDEGKLLDLKNDYKFISNIIKPGAKLRLPDFAFDGSITINGNGRKAELTTVGTAHSPGDSILYLPEDKVCFTGDLLFYHSHPWLGAGDPENFIKILEDLLKLDAEVFVPGHGELAAKGDIEAEIRYIKELLALVNAKKSKGETADSVSLQDMSPEFREWESHCFRWNIDFLFNRDK